MPLHFFWFVVVARAIAKYDFRLHTIDEASDYLIQVALLIIR